jgi:hypothetical protein
MAKETFQTVKDIFSVGKWNGDEYTESDIDEMIKNFERLTQEDVNFKVPLKVDFFKDKKDKSHGGQPAVGWVTKLKKEGKRLYAHIENIPKVVKELIETKAYRQVSAEIVWNMKKGEERLRRVLTGVALLGVEIPGVSNLEEFAALYSLELKDDEILKSYITENKESIMTEAEVLKLQEEKLAAEKSAVEAKEYTAKLEGEKKILEDKVAVEQRKSQDLADSQRKTEIKNFVEAKKTEGKILPAHEAQVMQIFDSLEESKTVKFTNAEGKEEEKSIRKVFESYIDSLPKIIDFKVKSKEGTDEETLKDFTCKPEDIAGSKESQILAEKAKKFAAEKKCSYSEALIAVSKQK